MGGVVREIEKYFYLEKAMNTPIEYVLVGMVALAVTIYLVIALLAPEKF